MKLKKHQIADKFIEGLLRDLSNSLIIVGEAGIGKTEVVLNTLKKNKLVDGKHFRLLNGYSSPLEFYKILKSVNNLEKYKILVLDDCEEFLNNQRIVGLLRGALWGSVDGKRLVQWHSTSPKVDSQEFEFLGKIIFLVNKLNLKNSLIQALISRGLFFHLELSNQEKIELMKTRVKEPYKNLSLKERIRIMGYLEEIGKFSNKLTLRSLSQTYNLYILSPHHYQSLINELLKP